ncbi:MAG TPA: hypothetical protein VLZ89_15015 [Anaerolineales bacterium]|nr:hypothetical protein [Anaerolineales bacterium]
MESDPADLLRNGVSPAQLDLIGRVTAAAAPLGFPIYIVGGFVRDLLLGRPGLDFDLVVQGDAIALARHLVSQYGGRLTIHAKFGTVKWHLREARIGRGEPSAGPRARVPDSLDLISARSEIYRHPAALPTVKLGTIRDDLCRRDFTINALALRLDGPRPGEPLPDELGGLKDLRAGLVRVLSEHSFVDDPTRMLRAVRYEKRYGFRISEETLALIPAARGLIERLSAQRIRHELDLILDEANAALMLARLDELDLLKPIHPLLHFDGSIRSRLEPAGAVQEDPALLAFAEASARDLRWLLWLMPLSGGEIAVLNERLHFTARLLGALLGSSRLWAELSTLADLKPSQWVARLDELPVPAIYAVSLAASRRGPAQALEQYLLEWRHIRPKTTGRDLKDLGIEAGSRYQAILRRLRTAWLDGEVTSETEEQGLLQKIIQ